MNLYQATASCRFCAHQSHQLDADREHAYVVVVEAMNKHIAESHPEQLRLHEEEQSAYLARTGPTDG